MKGLHLTIPANLPVKTYYWASGYGFYSLDLRVKCPVNEYLQIHQSIVFTTGNLTILESETPYSGQLVDFEMCIHKIKWAEQDPANGNPWHEDLQLEVSAALRLGADSAIYIVTALQASDSPTAAHVAFLVGGVNVDKSVKDDLGELIARFPLVDKIIKHVE